MQVAKGDSLPITFSKLFWEKNYVVRVLPGRSAVRSLFCLALAPSLAPSPASAEQLTAHCTIEHHETKDLNRACLVERQKEASYSLLRHFLQFSDNGYRMDDAEYDEFRRLSSQWQSYTKVAKSVNDADILLGHAVDHLGWRVDVLPNLDRVTERPIYLSGTRHLKRVAPRPITFSLRPVSRLVYAGPLTLSLTKKDRNRKTGAIENDESFMDNGELKSAEGANSFYLLRVRDWSMVTEFGGGDGARGALYISIPNCDGKRGIFTSSGMNPARTRFSGNQAAQAGATIMAVHFFCRQDRRSNTSSFPGMPVARRRRT